jgi:glycosyltransferase involved in cell wall biosynthesis
MLKLGFLSPHNAFDRRAFSGTVFHAARALAAHPGISLRILGNYRRPNWTDRLRRSYEIENVSMLDVGGLDAVLGLVASPLLMKLSVLHPDLPLFHVTDATPRFLTDVYGWQISEGAQSIEQRVVRHAASTIYSSRMMAARAPHDLAVPDLLPEVIPFGVNLETLPKRCPEKHPVNDLRLLFVGTDWVRKGGDIAIATLESLRARGRNARLTVVGRCPEVHARRPDVNWLGYLDKNRPRDRKALVAAYSDAHLLLLPSRADCTPMVVAEALAHGTPVIATNTGGISSLIGQSAGVLMPDLSRPAQWADEILALVDDKDRYAFTSESGFERAQTRLSWAAWAQEITEIMQTRLSQTVEKTVYLERYAS